MRVSWNIFLILVLCGLGPAAAEDQERTSVVGFLSESLEIGEVLAVAERYDLAPILLEGEFSVGSRPLHDFFSGFQAGSADEIEAEYARSRRQFLESMLGLDPTRIEFPRELRQHQRDIRKELRGGEYQSIRVVKVTFEGTVSDIEDLKRSEDRMFKDIQIAPAEDGQRLLISEAVTVHQPATVPATWYPNSGTSSTDKISTSERYVIQFMKWKNISFGSNATYEHDFRLYNYNSDGAYLNPASTSWPDCYPKKTYAVTDWPSSAYPYLDTRFGWTGCEKNELAYTIGVAQANSLKNNTPYYTYIATAKGNVDKDKFKVQAQRGYRSPSTCRTTWCSYPDAFEKLIPAWNTTVPGMVSWTKN